MTSPKQSDSMSAIRLRTVGRVLQKWRVDANSTQKELADALGYSTAQFISNWERGVSLPPLNALPKIAKQLKVRADVVVAMMETYETQIMKAQIAKLRKLLGGKAK